MDEINRQRIEYTTKVEFTDPIDRYANALYTHMQRKNLCALFEDGDDLFLVYPCAAYSANTVKSALGRGTFINVFPEATDYSYHKAWKNSTGKDITYFVAFPVDKSGHCTIRIITAVGDAYSANSRRPAGFTVYS